MASATFSRVVRPLAGSLGLLPLVAAAWDQRAKPVSSCEESKPKVFQKATCVKNEAHTHNTRLITLRLPEEWNEKGPVANVLVKASIEGAAKPVVRPYNPLSAGSGDAVTLLVKRYGDSALMGSKLHGLKAGDSVDVKGPNQQWSLPEKGTCKHYGMVAGGTGITPIIQAAEGILQEDSSATITLVTLNKSSKDVLLRKELKFLEIKYCGRLTVVHCVDAKTGGKDDVATDEEASASAPLLKALLPAPSAAGGVKVLVCGPKDMTAALAGPKTPDFKQGEVGGVLKDLGYKTEQVWKF